jgi:hypothetical protein
MPFDFFLSYPLRFPENLMEQGSPCRDGLMQGKEKNLLVLIPGDRYD